MRKNQARCGTYSAYKCGCRCDPCTAANAAQQRKYRVAAIAQHGYVPSQRNRNRATTERDCATCGTTFSARRDTSQRFCSLACNGKDQTRLAMQDRARRSQVALYTGPRLRRPCPTSLPTTRRTFKSGRCRVCGTWFVSLNLDVTCSIECHVMKRRIDKDKRRALKRAAYIADVSRKQVFERDGYRCHLCHRKTNPTKQVPHPRAPTIDHIIPLANHGTHEPLNCRTACFQCNSRKGNRGGGEQLLLIA